MAMLAEPRRKQKIINLRAKNNAWSNDSTKFGQRMLEKMGWSSGKGLGAHENGIVEHVIAKYKNDDRGLGFEDRNDQWTKHEDDFNSLLANLSNGDTKEEKLHSGISLEVKSKKSKARVHYHKFTRGKDLTRYSDKDLANIFGKKTLKNVEKAPETLKPDDLKTTEVIFTEKGSMVDYFKSKLAMKGKSKISITKNCDDDADYSFKGFAGTGTEEVQENEYSEVAFKGFSCYDNNIDENKTSEATIDNKIMVEPSENLAFEEPVKKKNKKNKKSKKDIEMQEENRCIDNNDLETLPEDNGEVSEVVRTKKCKKNKHKIQDSTEEETPKQKKNKKEHKIIEEPIEEEIHVPKKKKKRKNKDA